MAQDSAMANLIQTVAVLATTEGRWTSLGQPGNRIQLASVAYRDDEDALLRDDTGQFQVFTPDEWKAFQHGVLEGQFDNDAGEYPPKKPEEPVE